MKKAILGISAFYHDSAAALLVDGKIVAAAQEERFTRKKHDSSFPIHACRYVLQEAGLDYNSLSAVAFYEKPFLKFERLLETYHAFAPSGFVSFGSAMLAWIKEKIFMRRMLRKSLAELGDAQIPIYFPEHHLSHAASAFYPSPFEESAILTIDGVGEWATTTIGRGRGKSIEILKELHFPHSIGLLYSAFTFYTGFAVNSGEYKLMGLAPYGNPDSPRAAEYKKENGNRVSRPTQRRLRDPEHGLLRLRHRSENGERNEVGKAFWGSAPPARIGNLPAIHGYGPRPRTSLLPS